MSGAQSKRFTQPSPIKLGSVRNRRHQSSVEGKGRAVVVDGGGLKFLKFRQFIGTEKRTAARCDSLVDVVQEFEALIALLFGSDVAEIQHGDGLVIGRQASAGQRG